VPELGSLGTVRGALGNERPYREQIPDDLPAGCTVRSRIAGCRRGLYFDPGSGCPSSPPLAMTVGRPHPPNRAIEKMQRRPTLVARANGSGGTVRRRHRRSRSRRERRIGV